MFFPEMTFFSSFPNTSSHYLSIQVYRSLVLPTTSTDLQYTHSRLQLYPKQQSPVQSLSTSHLRKYSKLPLSEKHPYFPPFFYQTKKMSDLAHIQLVASLHPPKHSVLSNTLLSIYSSLICDRSQHQARRPTRSPSISTARHGLCLSTVTLSSRH